MRTLATYLPIRAHHMKSAMMKSRASTTSGSLLSSSKKRTAEQLSLMKSIERVQRYEQRGQKWKKLTDAVMFYLAWYTV